MKLSALRTASIALLILSAVAGSACSSSSPAPAAATAATQQDDVRVYVEAPITRDAGGTLTLPDGATLSIPPGALPADAVIRFAMLGGQTPADADHYYDVAPSMVLDTPARLTLPYRAAGAADDPPMLVAIESSMANALVDEGTEQTRWRDADVVDRDDAAGNVTIETHHFTGFGILTWVDDPAYLVVDVPGPYLAQGDVLVTLSAEHPVSLGLAKSTPNWFPGHVGVYVGPRAFGDGEKVLRPDGKEQGGEAGTPDIVESVKAGVKNGSLAAFRTGFDGDHIYLGPRRAPGKNALTDDERKAVAAYVLSQRGKGYNLVGDASNFLATVVSVATFDKLAPLRKDGKSCVGLADDALDQVGKSPVAWTDRHIVAVTPRDLYKKTVPVTEITVMEGDDLTIPVYGVVVDPASGASDHATLRGYYTRRRRSQFESTVSEYAFDRPTGLPADATWTGDDKGYTVGWVAKAPADGSDVTLHFHMNVASRATRRPLFGAGKPITLGTKPLDQDLVIHVKKPLVVVTDTSWTTDGGGSAAAVDASCLPGSWADASGLGARWIWSSPCTADDNESHTFSKDFVVDRDFTSAVLDVAADNFGAVTINGQRLADTCTGDAGQRWTTCSFDSTGRVDVTNHVVKGKNTISLVVQNHPIGASRGWGNPAGGLARLVVR